MRLFLLFYIFLSQPLWAENLLMKVDEYRNPSDSYQMKIKILSSTENDSSEFLVYLKGHDKTLIKVLAPRKNVGKNMLMIGEKMWVYLPNIKRSVRVSLNQKLTGEAANGDISRMRWDKDYDYQIIEKNKQETLLMLKEFQTRNSSHVKRKKEGFNIFKDQSLDSF